MIQEHPLSSGIASSIVRTRREISDIIHGDDARTIAIVGPCSLDDSTQADGTPSALRFAERIDEIRQIPAIEDNLLIIMRCPPSKPRTDLGWTGLEEDQPATARKLLADIANSGLPLGIEIMEREQLARYGDLLSLGWVGARNNKDTSLRRTLSAYSELPVFCKNDDHGDISPAQAAIATMSEPQPHARITLPDGRTGVIKETAGNPNGALLWRGGKNYPAPDDFERGLRDIAQAGLPYGIDCSHGNTQAHDPEQRNRKTVLGQLACFDHTIDIVEARELPKSPVAIMIEAYLREGADTSGETAGVSRTDPCVSLSQVTSMLIRMATTRF